MTDARRSRLLPYLQLLRAPNVFTAAADVAMGYLFVHYTGSPWGPLVCLMAASCFLYSAGMVLNDVYDADVDARERPQRPIPSGRVPLGRARLLGYQLLLLGVILGWCAGYLALDDSPPWRSGAVATALAACVVLYDAVLKKTVLGPLAMGGCRFLNVLVGMSTGAATGEPLALGFDAPQLLVAAGIGTYIVGVTWFARTEARESSRVHLAGGTLLMAAGIALLAFFPQLSPREIPYRIDPDFIWPLALFLMTFTILRRCLVAIPDPRPERVQAAVKLCILSLIVLDAAVCLLVCHWGWAVGVLALLAPTIILGKWVYST